jgi:hypothetical protein
MSSRFVDVENKNGEIQTVPEHYLESFPDQFKPVGPAKKSTAAKADTKKEA